MLFILVRSEIWEIKVVMLSQSGKGESIWPSTVKRNKSLSSWYNYMVKKIRVKTQRCSIPHSRKCYCPYRLLFNMFSFQQSQSCQREFMLEMILLQLLQDSIKARIPQCIFLSTNHVLSFWTEKWWEGIPLLNQRDVFNNTVYKYTCVCVFFYLHV